MTFKEFFSFRSNIVLWGNLLAIFILTCLLIAGTWFGLEHYTQHDQSVEIPTVKGLSRQDAINLIESRGLEFEIADSIYAKGQPAGRIVEQNPAPGSRVKSGRVVYLTVNSLSVPMTRLPDIANNSSVRQATAKLISSGFRLTEEEYINGDRDWVYDVKMNGRILKTGESIPIGATLTLVVGNGKFSQMDDDSIPFLLDSDPSIIDTEISEIPEPEPKKDPKRESPSSSTPSQPRQEDSWF